MQPESLGRYAILGELGRGAMGRVFLAHDPQIDRRVAIKIVQVFAALPEDERLEARERFLREARAVGGLAHPSIVTLHDIDEVEGLLYLVMEYVEGTTLEAHRRGDNLLPVATVVELVARAAEGLDYAHRSGVVHRDVKPANLIRVGDTAVKIADFGLAQQHGARLTRDGALLGTPSYMSPEQIRGQPIDGRSDQFSLAVVLYELLTGELPFPGDSISSIIYRIVHEEPRETAADPRVSPALARFLGRALAKEPERRFETASAFAAALRDAMAGTTRPTVAGDPLGLGRSVPAAAPHGDSNRISLTGSGWSGGRNTVAVPVLAVLGALLTAAVLAAVGWTFRDRLGGLLVGKPAEVWWQARVRTEPPGVEVRLDGDPLDRAAGGVVRFLSTGPFGVLSAEVACRRAEHRLEAADAGVEVVLVLDPVQVSAAVDPGVAGAAVRLNGRSAGTTPLELDLDLCRSNRLEIAASGSRPVTVDVPAGATPLAARSLLSGIALEPIPRGRLRLAPSTIDLVTYVDGRRVSGTRGEIELEEGEHELRLTNDFHWIDVRSSFRVEEGQAVTPDLLPPRLATLSVQAFPANCKVYLRRPGGSWRYVDETPATRQVAPGVYEVKVERNPTGEAQVRKIEVEPGDNPPVRVAFGRRS